MYFLCLPVCARVLCVSVSLCVFQECTYMQISKGESERFCWSEWAYEAEGWGCKGGMWEEGEAEGHSISCSMNLFKSISICMHIFITSAIIKSRHHRWCPHTVSLPGSHWANEAGLPVRPVSTDQVVMWRDRWALADRWQDDLENLPPFLGSGSSWQVLFHKITSKRNRQGLRINLRLQPAM